MKGSMVWFHIPQHSRCLRNYHLLIISDEYDSSSKMQEIMRRWLSPDLLSIRGIVHSSSTVKGKQEMVTGGAAHILENLWNDCLHPHPFFSWSQFSRNEVDIV